MVNYCCVPYCTNSALTPGISLLKIPKDSLLRKKWIARIRRGSETSDTMRVCSAHFLQSDFRENRKRTVLKQGTVPSVFPWQKENKKDIVESFSKKPQKTKTICTGPIIEYIKKADVYEEYEDISTNPEQNYSENKDPFEAEHVTINLQETERQFLNINENVSLSEKIDLLIKENDAILQRCSSSSMSREMNVSESSVEDSQDSQKSGSEVTDSEMVEVTVIPIYHFVVADDSEPSEETVLPN